MRNHAFRYTLEIASVCSLVWLASCEPNSPTIFPQGLNSITVLVRDNLAYPIFQFTCSGVEATGSSESCPDGFGCDAQHYHGSAVAIGIIAASGAADVTFQGNRISTTDPDQCHCGWGKVTEADIRTLSVFKVDVDIFAEQRGLQPVDDLTTAEQLSVDPCGG